MDQQSPGVPAAALYNDQSRFVLIEEPTEPENELKPLEAIAEASIPRAAAPASPPRAAAPASPPRADAPVSTPRADAPVSPPRADAPVSTPRADAPVSPSRADAVASSPQVDVRALPPQADAKILASSLAKTSSPPTPLQSTEDPDPTPMACPVPHPKKKVTAAPAKRGPKRTKNAESNKKPKKTKPGSTARGAKKTHRNDESDNGPYCICRGPDDHRWMICCESCEDWFHGECLHINKDIGESLIERFICPSCSTGGRVTLYKKTCGLGACRKPARLIQEPASVFCSNEHAQTWWERMIARLPKTHKESQLMVGLTDQLSQDELMAILSSDLGGVGEDCTWKIARPPFSGPPFLGDLPQGASQTEIDEALSRILSDEEKAFLDNAAKARFQLAEETILCHKMLSLVELAQDHRRAAITEGWFAEEICGYDSRLDTVSSRDTFAAYVKSPEGEATFAESKLADWPSSDGSGKGMCERKRCKIHSGWHKMMPLGVKYQIREMANQAAELLEEESIVREAASERWKRKQTENNWVEVVDV